MSYWLYEFGDLEVEVEGDFKPGDTYEVTPATVQPPDPKSIVIRHVWLGDLPNRIDLLPALRAKVVRQIEEDLLESES